MDARESSIQFRYAVSDDIPQLAELIERSVRELQAADYSAEQVDGSVRLLFSVDSQLLADCTYFVAEMATPGGEHTIVGCGGWSNRKTLFGGDHAPSRQAELLDPKRDAAKIRAIFVHPLWAGRGIGSRILAVCETAAAASGFTRFEMGSTLTGAHLYGRRGYMEYGRIEIPLPNGASFPIVLMAKKI
ncbi:MAG: Acetyltransferase, family [Bryobacterales bacterium]|nr:Acetyltransferase, family [Bryobacterales bacterium]